MRQYTPEEMVQRAYDVIEIKNVMAAHVFYHAAGRHDLELETLWAHKARISWGNMDGFRYGRDVIFNMYGEPWIARESGRAELFVHTLTTPLIEIAEDGQTAQAMWYTPGVTSGMSREPGIDEPEGSWMYERYAIDFILEDGEWKIWHFFVGTDFGFKAGTEYAEQDMPPMEQKPSTPGYLNMKAYTSKYGWCPFPQWPKPYKTWTPEIGYGPEKFLKEGE